MLWSEINKLLHPILIQSVFYRSVVQKHLLLSSTQHFYTKYTIYIKLMYIYLYKIKVSSK